MNAGDARMGLAHDDGLREEIGLLARLWWIPLAGGLVSVVIGILLLVWPGRTLEVIAILAGIELLLVGALRIGMAFGESERSRAGQLLLGALAGIAGLIVIRHPGGSLLVIALAIGIYLVLSGAMKLASAFDAIAGRGWLLLGAVFDLGIGAVIVAWPKFGVTSLAVLVGITLIIRGGVEVASSFALRSASHAV